MTQLDDFFGKKQAQNHDEVVALGGSFQCHVCYEDVDTAEHDLNTRSLKWVCSKGHVSRIEKFNV